MMVVKLKGHVRDGKLELMEPFHLPEGEVDVVVSAAGPDPDAGWAELGMTRLETEWDNPADAIYDDWRRLYGV